MSDSVWQKIYFEGSDECESRAHRMEGVVGELLPGPTCGTSGNSGYGVQADWLEYRTVSLICRQL